MKLLCAILLICCLPAIACAEEIRISAAASLQDVLTDLAKRYKAQGGDDIVLTFGASGQLATQIRNGAPADAFISAAGDQIADLVSAKLADPAASKVIAANTLVLVVPAKAKDAPRSLAGLAEPRFARIAIGNPSTVPAGDYASQTFTSLHLADSLAPRLVYGTNVRQVLAYVEQGEVAAGFVYATDAAEAGDKVRVVETVDPKLHAPIVYPAVPILTSPRRAGGEKFLDYLLTDKAQAAFREKGFAPPPAPATAPAQTAPAPERP